MNNSPSDLFVKVTAGKITGPLITREQITNRGMSVEWYSRVIIPAEPLVASIFEKANYDLKIENGVVYQTRTVTRKPLALVLHHLGIRPSDNPFAPSVPPLISDLSPEIVTGVTEMISDYATSKLEDFVRQKGYGRVATPEQTGINPIDSITGYRDSEITQFRDEYLHFVASRDQIWRNLLEFFQKVQTGEVPVPLTMKEIDALIPPLVWPQS